MIEIISNHESALELFEDGILARMKTDVNNPVEYLIENLESRDDENAKMILGCVNEAILHDMLYYTRD
jgi:hypothetical protein